MRFRISNPLSFRYEALLLCDHCGRIGQSELIGQRELLLLREHGSGRHRERAETALASIIIFLNFIIFKSSLLTCGICF